MRVALVVPTFPQVSETFVVTKALGLVQRGVDVQVVCSNSTAEQWNHFGPEHPVHGLQARVWTVPSTSPRWKAPLHVATSSLELARRSPSRLRQSLRVGGVETVARHVALNAPLIELAPDVVHFEFGALAVGRESLGQHLDCAMSVSFRGSDLAYIGLETPGYYDRLWSSLDGVHVLGAALWKRAMERGAPRDLDHTEIPPAVDLSHVPDSPSDGCVTGTGERPLRVLSVGRLHWTKAYDVALEAVAALQRRGVVVEYRIVGAGDLLPAVSFWRHQLRLDSDVTLLGALPPHEVIDQFQWADVLLHSAISEGFCNVVLEAQAHSRPVVCTDAGGLPENVDHEVTGLVVPRRDPQSLADGLERLAVDGKLRARMGPAGRERVERLFRLEDQIDAWVQFYEDAVAHREGRRRQ